MKCGVLDMSQSKSEATPKLRTPSGNEIENIVKDRRTIFSKTEGICAMSTRNSQQLSVKSSQQEPTRGIQAWLLPSSAHQSKQTVNHENPPMKVVKFHSVREKEKVMRHKANLKGIKNSQGKHYYINNYFPPSKLEKKKQQKWLLQQNELLKDEKIKMEVKGGVLWIDDVKHKSKIQPPNAQDLLNMEIQDMEEVVKLKLEHGPQREKAGNQFIKYTMCTSSLKQVCDANFKLRLAHPKARHIRCAYVIKDEEEAQHDRQGNCDDGEHGASINLLEILLGNNISQCAVYVLRYYSRVKIGPDRFDCICEAAEECVKLNGFNTITQQMQEISQPDEDREEVPPRKQTETKPWVKSSNYRRPIGRFV